MNRVEQYKRIAGILMTDILNKGNITRVEDHGTVVVAWLKEESGKETPVYFDHRQFQNLADAYGNTLLLEEFVYDGEFSNLEKKYSETHDRSILAFR